MARATRELLASRDDVWGFVSTPGRLADWWPGIFAAQDHGDHWTIEGDERQGLTNVADPGDLERTEDVAVEVSPPGVLHLRFARSGYDVTLWLRAEAPQRTIATLSIEAFEQHETAAERLEKVVGFAVHAGSPTDELATSILDRLYDLCQTGADA